MKMKKYTVMLEPELVDLIKKQAEKKHVKYQALLREYLWKQAEKTGS